jgi:hypothetical protein
MFLSVIIALIKNNIQRRHTHNMVFKVAIVAR